MAYGTAQNAIKLMSLILVVVIVREMGVVSHSSRLPILKMGACGDQLLLRSFWQRCKALILMMMWKSII